MKEFIIQTSPYLLAIIIFLLLKAISDKKKKTDWENWATPYEKRLRKQWEAEQQENQVFRATSKPLTQQSFEEWKAARKDTRGRD